MLKAIAHTWERLFPLPTKEKLAQEHLQESYREYLLACRNLENDEHLVMMHATRITRLESYLAERGVAIPHPMTFVDDPLLPTQGQPAPTNHKLAAIVRQHSDPKSK